MNEENKSKYGLKYIFNVTRELIGPMGAALTTWLLHDNRKISQGLNLANAINRAAFGTAFRMLPIIEKKNKLITGIWKILTNTSYIVTTLDVNTHETIFKNSLDSLSLEIPNKTPFSLFEISAISGVISGMLDIFLVFGDNKNLRPYIEKSQYLFDCMCPSFAIFGGISLGFIPEISWKNAAPYAATIDGIMGTWNVVTTPKENVSEAILPETFELIVPKCNVNEIKPENNKRNKVASTIFYN